MSALPLTSAELRKIIAASVPAGGSRLGSSEKVRLYARRLVEIGLVPEGKPGRGDGGSATLTAEQAARILVVCAMPMDPRDAAANLDHKIVDEVARIIADQAPARRVPVYARDGGIEERTWLSTELLGAVQLRVRRGLAETRRAA